MARQTKVSWGREKRKGVTEDCRWEKDSSTWWIKLSTLASPMYPVMPINSLKLKLLWELRVRVLMEGRNNSPFKDWEQFISYLRREVVTTGKEMYFPIVLGRKTCLGFEMSGQLHCRMEGDWQQPRPGSRRRNAEKGFVGSQSCALQMHTLHVSSHLLICVGKMLTMNRQKPVVQEEV